MNGQPVPAQELKVEIIHGGDAAAHQRRVQEWLSQSPDAQVVQIFHNALSEPNSRTGVSYSTMIVFKQTQ
ncbi:MAG: hypothetical protein HUU35_09710 [Armatimonadetes bacterium]|nr:hypothetical protein [Armatimonadota bacterium]